MSATPEEKKQVVADWVAQLAGGSDDVWSAFERYCAPDMVWTVIGTSPVSGRHEGLEAISRDFFEKCWNGGDGRGSGVQGLDSEVGLEMHVDNLLATEDGRVFVSLKADAVGNNKVPYKQEYCWLITVENGKLVDLYEWCDTSMFELAMFDKRIVPAESLAS